MKIDIAPELSIDDRELEISFIQAGGPAVRTSMRLLPPPICVWARIDTDPPAKQGSISFLKKETKNLCSLEPRPRALTGADG
jgi:hypothetical protein